MTASETIGAAAPATESAPLTVPTTSSSALLDTRMWMELSPWRISAAWSLAAAALAAGISDCEPDRQSADGGASLPAGRSAVGGTCGAGLRQPRPLPRIQETVLRNRLWLPYLAAGSPAARLFGQHGPSVLSILFRAWLPSVMAAFVVALAVGIPAVWATLAVLGIAVAGWLQRQMALISVSVLHSLVVVAMPWLLGLTLFGIDPWSGRPLGAHFAVDGACMGRQPLSGDARRAQRSGRHGVGAVRHRPDADHRPSSSGADGVGYSVAGYMAGRPSRSAPGQSPGFVDSGHAGQRGSVEPDDFLSLRPVNRNLRQKKIVRNGTSQENRSS